MRPIGVMILMLGTAGCGSGSGGQPAQSPGEPLECRHPEPIGPVVVPEAIYAARTGFNAVRFSQLNTSPQRPLEECGLRTVLQRLATLTCDDGSNPFNGDLRAAHASRAGNLGPGGRCNSILDQYDVPCRDKTYAVHADMYFCSEANVQNWLD